MTDSTWAQLADALDKNLHLTSPPLAITFSAEPPAGVEPFDAPMPDPMPDGRTGRVPAGCVFWMHAAARTFSTVADDHANCSVGSLTHGLFGPTDGDGLLSGIEQRLRYLDEERWLRVERPGGPAVRIALGDKLLEVLDLEVQP